MKISRRVKLSYKCDDDKYCEARENRSNVIAFVRDESSRKLVVLLEAQLSSCRFSNIRSLETR